MLRPLLIVGVGGSGGKTVRRLRQSLLRQLRRVPGWTGEMPQAWQLVWIDWLASQGSDGDSSPLLPSEDYLGLWPNGVPNWGGTYPKLLNSLPSSDHAELLAGWFDPELQINPQGGGQARAAGRNLGAIEMKTITQRMGQWHAKMTSDSATAQLAALERCLGMPSEGQREAPMAIVISSLAGGTGAGLFMEVLTAMHAVDEAYAAAGGTATMLYTADVFGALNANLVEQVAANGLAAAMEVTSGVLSRGRSSQSTELLSNLGVLPGDGKFACTYNFLIGSKNASGVTFNDQNEVYQAVGECLSTLVLNDSMLESLVKFSLLAAFNMVANVDNTRLKDPADNTQTYPFSGIGVAKVAIGTDRLGDYAAQVLTRDIVEQLMWPTYLPDDGTKVPEQERIDESADNNFPRFLERSGLNEINPANDVLIALAGDNPVVMPNQPFDLIYSRAEVNSAAQWADSVTTHAPQQEMSGAEWQQTFQTYWVTQRQAPLSTAEAELWSNAQTWTSTIQNTLTNLVAQTAIDLGLNVTDQLITRLLGQIDSARSELEIEASELAVWSDGQLNEALRQLSVGKAKMTASDGVVGQAIASFNNGILFACAAKRHEVAAALLADLKANFLVPLQTTIQTWRVRLGAALDTKVLLTGQENPWPVMPRFGRPTPTQFLPGPVEKLLIDPANFEGEVQQAIKDGLPDTEKNSWQILARQRAGLGLDLATGEGVQTLLKRTADWVPTLANAQPTQGPPTKASFVVPFEHLSLMEGTETWQGIEAWLSTPAAAELGKLLKIDLHTYVNSGDPQTRLAREQALQSAFTAATLAAAPLVSVKQAVASAVHGTPGNAFSAVVSPIPFPPGDPLFDALKTQLVSSGLAQAANADGLFKTRAADNITFLTSNSNAMQAVVFDNVMAPAASDWQRRKANQQLREIFWRWRRARPLPESLPIAGERLRVLIRGWFVAELLGQMRTEFDREVGPRIEIWCADQAWKSFPVPLLSRSPGLPRPSRKGENFEYLAAVLKSMSLALLDVYQSASIDPLAPYHRLLDLGGDVQNEIGDWIDYAKPSAPNPESAAGTGDMSADERQQAVTSRIVAIREQWQAHIDEFRGLSGTDVRRIPASFEISADVIAALDELLAVARN
jgi:hypothetical protein